MEAERRAHPDAEVQVWSEDEARLGLISIVRRVWALRGERPIATSRRRYQWLYVYGFVRPTTGEVFWLLLPTVRTDVFQIALELFAKTLGVGPDKRVLLVVDGAGWHVSNDLRLPDGLRLVRLPPYSPELQPSERLWPLLHEAVANRSFDTLDEFESVLRDRCAWLSEDVETVRRRVHFHWWPADGAHGR